MSYFTHLIRIGRSIDFNTTSASAVSNIRMGQSNTRPRSNIVKADINPDYQQTYGKEDEVDVAIDKNQDYQPSDYDEFDYESSIYVTLRDRDDSRKVRYF